MLEIKNINVNWNSNEGSVKSCCGHVLVEENYWFEGIVSFNGEDSYVLGGLTNNTYEFLLFGDNGERVFKFSGERNDEGSIGECLIMHDGGHRTADGVCCFVLASSSEDLSMDDLQNKIDELKSGMADFGRIFTRKFYYHYCEGWYGEDVVEDELVDESDNKVFVKENDWWEFYPGGMPF